MAEAKKKEVKGKRTVGRMINFTVRVIQGK
jgi:hypothetical protein